MSTAGQADRLQDLSAQVVDKRSQLDQEVTRARQAALDHIALLTGQLSHGELSPEQVATLQTELRYAQEALTGIGLAQTILQASTDGLPAEMDSTPEPNPTPHGPLQSEPQSYDQSARQFETDE